MKSTLHKFLCAILSLYNGKELRTSYHFATFVQQLSLGSTGRGLVFWCGTKHSVGMNYQLVIDNGILVEYLVPVQQHFSVC